MKKLYFMIITMFFLGGCVTSDPAVDLANEINLIGTWESQAMIIGKVRDTLLGDDGFVIKFMDNKTFGLGETTGDISETLNNMVTGVECRYTVRNQKIVMSITDNTGETIDVSVKFKLDNNMLIVSQLTLKSNDPQTMRILRALQWGTSRNKRIFKNIQIIFKKVT